ncbi:molybdopterin converting factor subunit 1 [Desmospora profundinema]|uniref:Molybdopterin synthase catalytic subunit n=1 Tax=Desmospora profundinema TaxID=1571184 RepID=A0ABU1IUW6_9BACL|nr:molybdopterin converting factor subunit 1 [Desmospora profundinema]MDR6227545.1 molybdopterin synthase catalytic subunit [Desmospora profundinema]
MEIRILLFAAVAETIGQRSITLQLPPNASVRDLVHRLEEEYPKAAEQIRFAVIARNQEYADPDETIHPGDEIALIPPVSGGETDEPSLFAITEEPLSADRLIAQVSNPQAGAVLTFAGTVREFTDGRRTVHLEYEAYAPMAIREMKAIAQEIHQQWPGVRVAMVHRVGKLEPEEISVLIAVASPHRPESFEAGRYAIERLKESVPIWKKEIWEDGTQWQGSQTGTWDPRKPADPS